SARRFIDDIDRVLYDGNDRVTDNGIDHVMYDYNDCINPASLL
ncbi:Os09g0447100, partial [Oryza sativa Japonica Group]